MAKKIKLPRLSEDADEGTVAEVMIKEGDTIGKDDSVIAVESDKATVEVPAEEAGTVKEVKVSEGDTIKTGDVIAVLEDEDESEEDEGEQEEKSEEDLDEKGEDEQKQKSEKGSGEEDSDEVEEKTGDEKDEQKEKSENQEVEEKSNSVEKKESEVKDGDSGEDEEDEKKKEKESEKEQKKEPAEDEDRQSNASEEKAKEGKDEGKESTTSEEVHAAPGAKRLAREHAVNLEDVNGSGPDGLITSNDVKKAGGLSAEEGDASGVELPDFNKWGTIERQPLSEIRKATAKQTQSSWQAIPHVTQFDEANVSGIEEYIEQHQDKVEEKGGKLTITAVLTKVMANALHQFPKFNASIDMEAGEVILKKYIHIGIAADTERGLLVPVVRDVDEKSIVELAVEIDKLAEQARNEELSKEDMEGANVIISNLGGIGGTQFTPVIFHPHVAILGVSAMETKPVYNEKSNSFQPVLTLPLSLSYDHRLIDGAEGVRFLRYLCNALEDPYKALLGE